MKRLALGLLLLLINFDLGNAAPSQTIMEALMDFYNSLNGPFWTNSNWTAGSDPCVWSYIRCGSPDVITEIRIFGQNMTGTLPDSIGNITSLIALELHGALHGTIPNSIHNLNQLVLLALFGQLSGTIPNLPNVIQVLVLSNNNLIGTIPESLTEAPNLLDLILNNNPYLSCSPNLNVNPSRSCDISGIACGCTSSNFISACQLLPCVPPPTEAPTHPPTYPPTHPPTYPPTRPPTYPPTRPPTYLPTYLPTHPPTWPSTRPSTLSPTHSATDSPTLFPSLKPSVSILPSLSNVIATEEFLEFHGFNLTFNVSSSVVLVGDLSLNHSTTIVISGPTMINITGCVKLSGKLIVNTSEIRDKSVLRNIINSGCPIQSTFDRVETVGSPPCSAYTPSQEIRSHSYFVLLSQTACGRSFPVYGIVLIVVFSCLVTIFLVVALKVEKIRKVFIPYK